MNTFKVCLVIGLIFAYCVNTLAQDTTNQTPNSGKKATNPKPQVTKNITPRKCSKSEQGGANSIIIFSVGQDIKIKGSILYTANIGGGAIPQGPVVYLAFRSMDADDMRDYPPINPRVRPGAMLKWMNESNVAAGRISIEKAIYLCDFDTEVSVEDLVKMYVKNN